MPYDNLRDVINRLIEKHNNGNMPSFEEFSEFNNEFNSLMAEGLDNARLAHYKCAIEFIERKYKDRETTILYTSQELPSGAKALVKYIRGNYVISVNPNLSAEDKRIQIGHELGHILISNLNDTIYRGNIGIPDKKSREFLANVISYAMHVGQSDHYTSPKCKQYQYTTDAQKQKLLKKIVNSEA